MNAAHNENTIKKNVTKEVIIILMFLCCSLHLFAETAQSVKVPDHRDFAIAFPVYFFDEYTVSGIQAGYQFKKCLVRMEMDFVNVISDNTFSTFLMPSVGVFYVEEWSPSVRVSQGLAIGGELNTKGSFEVNTIKVNFFFGAEFLAIKNKSFFVEMGPCLGIIPKTGSVIGGSVIGGGIRLFF